MYVSILILITNINFCITTLQFYFASLVIIIIIEIHIKPNLAKPCVRIITIHVARLIQFRSYLGQVQLDTVFLIGAQLNSKRLQQHFERVRDFLKELSGLQPKMTYWLYHMAQYGCRKSMKRQYKVGWKNCRDQYVWELQRPCAPAQLLQWRCCWNLCGWSLRELLIISY